MTDLEVLENGGTFFLLPPGDKAPPPTAVTGKGVCLELDAAARGALLEGAAANSNAGLLLGRRRVQMPDGSFRGVFVVDEDNKPEREGGGRRYAAQRGAETIAALEARLGPLPITLTSKTPGHGLHRLFWAREELADVPAKILRRDVSFGAECGVEILTEGRYIVYPGSSLSREISEAKGYVAGTYLWDNPNAPIADLPETWIAYLSGLNGSVASPDCASDVEPVPIGDLESPYAKWRLAAAEEYLRKAPLSIRGQGGRDDMFKIACVLVRLQRLPVDVAAAVIDRVYNPRLLAAGTTTWSIDKPGPKGGCLRERLESARSTSHIPEGSVPTEAVWLDCRPPERVEPCVIGCIDDLGERWGGWDRPVQPVVYLLEGLIPENKVCTFFAEGGSVKSWAAFNLAISVSTGEPWLGRSVQKGRALILDYEDGEHEFQRRIRILRKGMPEDLPDLGYKYAAPTLDREDLWSKLAKRGLRLLVIDTLGSGMPGDADENVTKFASAVKLAGLFTETTRQQAATPCTVVIVAHANKSGGLRGSSAIRDSSDVAFKFEPVSETDSVKRMRMTCDKPGPQRRPSPVNIELSDAGLCTFEDEAGDTARNAATKRDLEAAILLLLAEGVPMVKARIEERLGGNVGVLRKKIRVLHEERKIRKVSGGWTLDDAGERVRRVLDLAPRFNGSAAGLGASCGVPLDEVKAMMDRGLVLRSGSGFFVP